MKNFIKIINFDNILIKNINKFNKLFIKVKKHENDIIFNNDIIILIINRKFLYREVFNYIIKQILISIKIRDIKNIMISLIKHIYFKITFRNILINKFVIKKLRRQIHIIKDFKINILFDLNILKSKKIKINYIIKSFMINNCKEIKILMQIILIRDKIYKIIRVYNITIISLYFNILILIKFQNENKTKFSKNRNFIFILIKNFFNRFELNNNVLNYIININIYII